MMPTRRKLLLVDDEEDLVRIVHTYFTDEGYEVRTADSGENGLSVLEEFAPDVIISDVQMEGIDGFEFMERCQKVPALANIPFVFLTIVDEKSSVEHAMSLGASAYVTKPFDVEELDYRIRQILSKGEDP